MPFKEALVGKTGCCLAISNSLTTSEVDTALELNLASTDKVIFEIVQYPKFVLNEIKMDHSVLERLSLGIFSTLITAASQDRVEDEDGNARDHENWILKQENDQVEI